MFSTFITNAGGGGAREESIIMADVTHTLCMSVLFVAIYVYKKEPHRLYSKCVYIQDDR